MAEKKKKTKKPTAPRPRKKPDEAEEAMNNEGFPTITIDPPTKKPMMGGGKIGKPIKYEIGGMVKPAYMRNR